MGQPGVSFLCFLGGMVARIGEMPDWIRNQARIQFFWRGWGTEIGNPYHNGDMQNRQKEYGYARDGGREEVGEESLCVLLGGRS